MSARTQPAAREFHPASMIFPLMDDESLQALADDIRENGLRVTIMVDDKGRIVDGRNRQTACLLAGVAPKYGTIAPRAEEEIADLVWSLNSMRRHITPDQLAAARLKMDEYVSSLRKEADKAKRAGQKKGGGDRRSAKARTALASSEAKPKPNGRHENKTTAKVAASTGSSRASVERIKFVKENAPDLFEKIEQNKIKTNSAYNQAKQRQKKAELDTKAKAAKEMMQGEPTWTLIEQDVMAGLQSVIDHHAPARLIFADPPYNIGVNYGDTVNDSRPAAEYMAWVSKWLGLCGQALADDGSLWVMIGDEYAAEYAVEIKDYGFTIRSWIKWYETFGVNCSNNFNRTSRHIFYCVRNPKSFVFNPDAVTRPSDRQVKYKDKRAASGGKIWDDVWQIPRLTGTANERIPDFPTQLPLDLLRAIVGCASEPGDLVVDPFNGSGTTGVACIESSRRYIGIDNSEAFIDIATQRLTVAQHERD